MLCSKCQAGAQHTSAIISLGKKRIRDLAEFQTAEYATRLEYSIGFLQDSIYMCAVPDAKRDRVKVLTFAFYLM